MFEWVQLQRPGTVICPESRTQTCHPSGGHLLTRDLSPGHFWTYHLAISGLITHPGVVTWPRSHHLAIPGSVTLPEGCLPAWDPSPGRTQAPHPSGGHQAVRDPSPSCSWPVTCLQAVSTSGTRRPAVPRPVTRLEAVPANDIHRSTSHVSRPIVCQEVIIVTVSRHPDPPSPVMYPGFGLRHGILHQMATVAVPRHVFPWNRNISGSCRLPIIMCILQRVVSSNLQLVHRLVLYILTVLESLGTAAHVEGGQHSSTPSAWLPGRGLSLPMAFSQHHSRSRSPVSDSCSSPHTHSHSVKG